MEIKKDQRDNKWPVSKCINVDFPTPTYVAPGYSHFNSIYTRKTTSASNGSLFTDQIMLSNKFLKSMCWKQPSALPLYH